MSTRQNVELWRIISQAILLAADQGRWQALQMDLRATLNYRRASLEGCGPFALGTLVRTDGSTYEKAGAQVLIDSRERCHGLISGGCLEAGLVVEAESVLSTGTAKLVCYDAKMMTGSLLGFNLGCQGSLMLLLERITNLAKLESLVGKLTDETPHLEWIVWRQSAGSHLLGHVEPHCDLFQEISRLTPEEAAKTELTLFWQGESLDLIKLAKPPPATLSIYGAGRDALPICTLAADLGFVVHIFDHREAFLSREHFPKATSINYVVPTDLDLALETSKHRFHLVMTHNFDHDLAIIGSLTRLRPRYLGVLGPRSRKQALMARLAEILPSEDTAWLEASLRGPIGLDLGGRGPESVALAIIAEIHSLYYRGTSDA